MDRTVDAIVLGLGGMGSAAAAHLAARGAHVLGLEQFTPAHDRGSSHGDSRIIRQAYFEDPAYVPLLQRAYELYDDLNRDDPGLFVQTAGLMIGTPDSHTVSGTLASAEQHDLPHEVLDREQTRRRFPVFALREGEIAVLEPRAGFVRPERTVRAHLARAAAHGADLRFGERVLQWSEESSHVRVTTEAGTYRAEQLVIACGAWAPQFADLGAVPMVVERQLLHWYRPVRPESFDSSRMPVYIWETAPDTQIYGFPALPEQPERAKVAFFRRGTPADPDQLDREVRDVEGDEMTAAVRAVVPDLAGTYLRGLACMYTTTPDEHFVIGRHPAHGRVIVAAGFSGHGFKFAPVVGEILTELVLAGTTSHPIGLFDPTRFAASATGSLS